MPRLPKKLHPDLAREVGREMRRARSVAEVSDRLAGAGLVLAAAGAPGHAERVWRAVRDPGYMPFEQSVWEGAAVVSVCHHANLVAPEWVAPRAEWESITREWTWRRRQDMTADGWTTIPIDHESVPGSGLPVLRRGLAIARHAYAADDADLAAAALERLLEWRSIVEQFPVDWRLAQYLPLAADLAAISGRSDQARTLLQDWFQVTKSVRRAEAQMPLVLTTLTPLLLGGVLAGQLKADRAACDAALEDLLVAYNDAISAPQEVAVPTADADGVTRLQTTLPVQDNQFLLLDPAASRHAADPAGEAPWSDEAWERRIDVTPDGLAIRADSDWTEETRVSIEVWPTTAPTPAAPWKPMAEAGIEAHGTSLTLVSLYGDPERDGTRIHLARPGHYQCRVSVRDRGETQPYLLQLWLHESESLNPLASRG